MVEQMLELMKDIPLPVGEERTPEDDTMLALWHGLNACKTRLTK